ncbi:zonular occludens toxin domain-containing protein [Marinobacter alexandrii]|uniref:zonular occludens toxin domain-containing protein n=1 Tax=Marinobacter alexandrii TaxID=2570351 RepID=UPI001108142E|nr:zonular occludens toxin domain-containing protein [Marinobacter alexandrii]
MSIVGYAGLPGSGKSYGVVENVVIPALDAGRHIITNIPLKLGRLSDDYPQGRVTMFDNKEAEEDPTFFDLERHPAGVIWIIDEAWRFWKSGMKATNIPQCQKEFFTEHRHNVGPDGRTNEIVLVTQDLAQLCAFVRGLVEETYRAVKLTAIGQKNKYRVDVYMGAATGQKPGKPMRQLYGSYKPEIYQYYKSHTRNKTDFAAGMEEKADDRANVLKHPLIKYGIPVAILIMVLGVWKAVAYFSPDEHTEETTPGAATEVRTQQASQQQAITTSQGARTAQRTRAAKASLEGRAPHQVKHELEPGWLPLSNTWRIVGEVNNVYWIWGETGTRKIHSRNCARFLKTGEPFCVIQGKLVTYYSYREPERTDEDKQSRSSYLETALPTKEGDGA